jgi:hypothetical protein
MLLYLSTFQSCAKKSQPRRQRKAWPKTHQNQFPIVYARTIVKQPAHSSIPMFSESPCRRWPCGRAGPHREWSPPWPNPKMSGEKTLVSGTRSSFRPRSGPPRTSRPRGARRSRSRGLRPARRRRRRTRWCLCWTWTSAHCSATMATTSASRCSGWTAATTTCSPSTGARWHALNRAQQPAPAPARLEQPRG